MSCSAPSDGVRHPLRELAPSRQQSLQRTLEAAANQMPDGERRRSGPGPPPLLSLLRPLAGPPHLQPHCMLLDVHGMHRLLSIAESGSAKSINPFIYNPFKPVCSPQLTAGAFALLHVPGVCS